jgi:hypothetical protein
MLAALGNVNPSHLLDRELLGRTGGSTAREGGELLRIRRTG